MSLNNLVKKSRRLMARYGMFSSYWMMNKLPYPVVKRIARVFIAIGLTFTKTLQRAAKESLSIAFHGEKSESEINHIIKKCFANFGQGMIEMLYYMEHPEMIREYVYIDGRERLDAALSKGSGIVAVTAHFGNFPLMMLKLVQEGYPCHVLMRTTRDEKINKFLLDKRTAFGLKTIFTHPRAVCVQQCLKALRKNDIIFMLMDQNFGSDGGIFVDFFGHKAATATGPVVLAERTDSPILPIFIHRNDDGHHQIIMEPSFQVIKGQSEQETLEVNTVKITKIIEKYVRQYPYEWGWMHRRWKTQPPQLSPNVEP